ncbi:MAG TPA: hypothetical protein VIK41_07940, partial [Gemmatimonadaceae bacterium]
MATLAHFATAVKRLARRRFHEGPPRYHKHNGAGSRRRRCWTHPASNRARLLSHLVRSDALTNSLD